MIISLVMPWRPTPDRIPVFNKLIKWYQDEIPYIKINTVDAGGEIFNLSASRNKGIKQAIDEGADVVIVSDADAFPDKSVLLQACANAYITKNITAAYTRYIAANREDFENDIFTPHFIMLAPDVSTDIKEQTLYPCSGVIVIPKEVWHEIGGFDENYVGWGPEDQDYHRTYLNRYKKIFDYIKGDLFVVEHDRSEWKIEDLNLKNNEYFKGKNQ